MADDPDNPTEGKWLSVFYPEEFLQDAAKRGVTPELLLGRLGELTVEADREARELFSDWEAWTQEAQIRFCMEAARARAYLEFPYLDDEAAD